MKIPHKKSFLSNILPAINPRNVIKKYLNLAPLDKDTFSSDRKSGLSSVKGTKSEQQFFENIINRIKK